MQIPQNWTEVQLGMILEKDGKMWKVIRIVEQWAIKSDNNKYHERFIQLLDSEHKVEFHEYLVEEM